MRRSLLILSLLSGMLLVAALQGQATHALKPSAAGSSLTDLPALMLKLQAHQRELDKVRENYTYRETLQTDDIDSSGRVKKSETEEYQIFFVNSHHIRRLVKRNGRELSPDEQKKEQEHVAKQVEKATRLEPGKSMEGGEISISRILAIMKLFNPRRVPLNGRNTIAFDFDGDPHAQTHGMAEGASKKMSGTLWIDEKDMQVARLNVRFDENFRVGAGLVATVQAGSSFEFDQAPVNNEVWLPTSGAVHLDARVMLFKGYRQNIRFHDGDYQRFHVEASQQPEAIISSRP